MVPTRIKELIPEVAKEVDIPQEHLSLIVSVYYKELRRSLSDFKYLHIKIPGLGRMTIKGWLLQEKIDEVQQKMSRAATDIIRTEYQGQLDRLVTIKAKWDIQEKDRKQVISNRKQ